MARKLAEITSTTATKEDLADQVATLRADVSALTDLLGEYGKNKSQELTSTAKETMASVRDETKLRAAIAAETASEKANELHDQANDFVKSQPAMAMGLAAGMGFLIGFMSGRK